MASAMKKFLHYFRPTVKTITTDNDREFSHNDRLEHKYHIPFYFCDPYSPWERGTNERMNKRIRWFFPDKTNFKHVSDNQIVEAIDLINHRPLKVLNWKSAIQVFHYDFIHHLD